MATPPLFHLTQNETEHGYTDDGHALYRSLDDAIKAFEQEVADCQENFNVRYGSTLIDLPRCKEWRTEDGYGYTVTVDEMIPL